MAIQGPYTGRTTYCFLFFRCLYEHSIHLFCCTSEFPGHSPKCTMTLTYFNNVGWNEPKDGDLTWRHDSSTVLPHMPNGSAGVPVPGTMVGHGFLGSKRLVRGSASGAHSARAVPEATREGGTASRSSIGELGHVMGFFWRIIIVLYRFYWVGYIYTNI